MKRIAILSLTLALLLPLAAQAQNEQQEIVTDSLQDEDAFLPEGMQEHEIDSLLHDWTVRSYLTFDENCQSTGENPTFEPDVYISRLQRLPNVVDMPYNDVVQQYIDRYSSRLRTSVSVMLGASNFYNPLFEEALETYQVPLELKYLPIIESALNPAATSRVGAAGLWQFMIGTGKQYGLEVTSLIDERRDPIKSSYAAARYLRDLYNIFGDWTLAIASYNCGPANVSKAIKRAGGEADYWAIYPYLPRETRGYVPAFIAANYIMNYYCDHNICPINTKLPLGTDTLMVDHNVRLEAVAEACEVAIEELKALNPQYRTTLVPGGTHPCALRLPSEKVGRFIEVQDSLYANAPTTSRRAVVPIDAPGKGGKSGGKAASGTGQTITVKKGDTLGALARRHHTTVARIKSLNGLRSDNLRIGQRLRVK